MDNMKQKTIAILGLGWLGFPLAKALLACGYKVKGSVTSSEKISKLEGAGIELSVVKLYDEYIEYSDARFFNADILFINFPPKRVKGIESIYPNQVKHLLPLIQQYGISKVVFVSSTSVYNETNGVVTEDDELRPEKPSGIACLNAENVLRQSDQFATTVIRFGGLIGADRNPHRFMKRSVKNGPAEMPVNLIHLDDCIGIVQHILENKIWNEVINGCCPVHPVRKEFYQTAAKIAGLELPQFDNKPDFKFKRVSSERLTNQFGYHFKYQSPVDYLKSLDYLQDSFKSPGESISK